MKLFQKPKKSYFDIIRNFQTIAEELDELAQQNAVAMSEISNQIKRLDEEHQDLLSEQNDAMLTADKLREVFHV